MPIKKYERRKDINKNEGKIFTFNITILLIVLSTMSCASVSDSGYDMLQASGHKLAYRSSGEGSTTVLFESGLGDDASTWINSGILEQIELYANVVVYNRAGNRPSEDSDKPATMENKISDLHALISTLPENNKLILVGHSLGGSLIRSYAVKYPDQIVGLLFVDTQKALLLKAEYEIEDILLLEGEELDQLFKEGDELEAALQGIEDGNLKSSIELYHPRKNHPVIKENEQYKENYYYIRRLPPLPDVPAIAITSFKDYESLPEDVWDLVWKLVIRMDQKLGEDLKDFTHKQARDSGHYIQEDRPDLIVESIRELLDKTKS